MDNPDAILVLMVYLSLLILYLGTELMLVILNLRHVLAHRQMVPKEVSESIDLDTQSRAVEYTLAKGKLSLISLMVNAVFIVVVVFSGVFGTFDAWLRSGIDGEYVRGIAFVFSTMLLFSLVDLPLNLYQTFVIEERFGFNKTTLRTWIIDRVKGLLVSFCILTPLLLAVLWFMKHAGIYWWAYAAAAVIGIQLLVVFIFPTWIAPLFNRFEPLAEGTLREKILKLAKKLHFETAGIFTMDGSKRSAHGNAYFTGLGRNRRIVLFDTLINQLNEDQVAAVLAHEIGHQKKHHVKKMLVMGTALTVLGFWVMSLLLAYKPLYFAFGFYEESHYAALVIFSILSGPVTFFLSPLMSAISRLHEYEADRFAREATNGPDSLIHALISLSKNSLSNLAPHPWYSAFHYSHPTLVERIRAMRS